jgi:hypothetical protein
MIQKPILTNTVVSNDNYEWRPVDFKSFLTEKHIQNIINEACLFRGHRKTDRLLDSTFARNLNQLGRTLHTLLKWIFALI